MEQFDRTTIEIAIEKVAFGSQGIGFLDGKAVFVAEALPGDLVEAEIVKNKKNYSEAKLVRIIKKSSLRVSSPCPYLSCGGCQWLEAPVSTQLEWKKSFVAEALSRVGKIELQKQEINLHPSPTTSFYRNRVLLRGTVRQDGSIGVGYFKKASRTQIPVENCYIAANGINRIIDLIRNARVSSEEQKFRIELQEFPKFEDRECQVSAVLHPVEKKTKSLDSLLQILKSHSDIIWAGYSKGVLDAPIFPFELAPDGLVYFTAPGQFFQVNLLQNYKLRQIVEKFCDDLPSDTFVLDLFCGSGNLSLSLANGLRSVVGVEQNTKSIQIASHSVSYNKLKGISYHAESSLNYLKNKLNLLSKKNLKIVIADPPRAGMKECITFLLKMNPDYIIYASCDPLTLARDLNLLSHKYRIKNVEVLDFFPHTYHVESVVFLQKV